MEIRKTSSKINTKSMVLSALLVALSVVIPLLPLPKIVIEPFSATPASHLPAILSMFMGPYVCIATSIGSALGFMMTLGPVVAMRALSHVLFALFGCFMLKKKVNIFVVAFLTMLIHGASETVVALVYGSSFSAIWMTVGLFTMIHHCIDFILTMIIYRALKSAKMM